MRYTIATNGSTWHDASAGPMTLPEAQIVARMWQSADPTSDYRVVACPTVRRLGTFVSRYTIGAPADYNA